MLLSQLIKLSSFFFLLSYVFLQILLIDSNHGMCKFSVI